MGGRAVVVVVVVWLVGYQTGQSEDDQTRVSVKWVQPLVSETMEPFMVCGPFESEDWKPSLCAFTIGVNHSS